ncbi:hypothetical protein BH09DEP1_BH09DEP1_0600 [soil metagenome]
MKVVTHRTAKPSDYNKESESYDAFNESHSTLINYTTEQILKKYNVQTVLDLACGTGSQVFWLTQQGFNVTGSDINQKMLKIAKGKAILLRQGGVYPEQSRRDGQEKENIRVRFLKDDMRTAHIGEFDAVITIFNSIGHLTKADFEIAINNTRKNLKKDGLYIFDIANLNYFLKDDHITDLTVDWLTTTNDTQFRDIQYSTINADGILAFYTTSIIQKRAVPGVAQGAQTDSETPKISKSIKTLQIYTAVQLQEMLNKNGFTVLEQCAIDGSKFDEHKTDRILTIARKQ